MFLPTLNRWSSGALLALLLVLAGQSARAERPYEESEKKHSWLSLTRPSRDTAAAQLEYAEELRARSSFRKAGKAYRALVITWPGSPQAAAAQYGYAQMLDARGKLLDAFDEYEILMTRFVGGFPYDAVLQRQFEIARGVMDRRRGKFLLFGGFRAPERAVPLFESVVKNGPRADFAPEAQYLVGKAYELSEQLELAVVGYMTAQHRYPLSPFAQKAAFGRAHCLYRLAEENQNDDEALEQAWAGVTVFINTFPMADEIEVAKSYRETLLRRRAKTAYDRAVFYDHVARKPTAALQAYQSFAQLFPNSEWTSVARVRIDELSKTVEKPDEK